MSILLDAINNLISANSLVLAGSTSGSVTVVAPAIAGSSTVILPASNSAIATVKQTEIDFGSTGLDEETFIIADASVTANSIISGTIAYVAPTSKSLDEMEMDSFELKFAPGAGQFTLYITTTDGSLVADKFKVNYTIG